MLRKPTESRLHDARKNTQCATICTRIVGMRPQNKLDSGNNIKSQSVGSFFTFYCIWVRFRFRSFALCTESTVELVWAPAIIGLTVGIDWYQSAQ